MSSVHADSYTLSASSSARVLWVLRGGIWCSYTTQGSFTLSFCISDCGSLYIFLSAAGGNSSVDGWTRNWCMRTLEYNEESIRHYSFPRFSDQHYLVLPYIPEISNFLFLGHPSSDRYVFHITKWSGSNHICSQMLCHYGPKIFCREVYRSKVLGLNRCFPFSFYVL